jgi:CheY-like chemotaxis protein
MDKKGPIVLIDDDDDDLHLLIQIFADMSLPNEIHLFRNPSSVIAFLQRPDIQPFLIISDINMPQVNGFELMDMMKKDPLISQKKVPHLFFSTASSLRSAEEGSDCFQGIFTKPDKHSAWKDTLSAIVKYWTLSMPQDKYAW